MDGLTQLNLGLIVVNLAVLVATVRRYVTWRTRPAEPHPLAAPLREIAAALRESRPAAGPRPDVEALLAQLEAELASHAEPRESLKVQLERITAQVREQIADLKDMRERH